MYSILSPLGSDLSSRFTSIVILEAKIKKDPDVGQKR